MGSGWYIVLVKLGKSKERFLKKLKKYHFWCKNHSGGAIWFFQKIKRRHFQVRAGTYIMVKLQANLVKCFWTNREEKAIFDNNKKNQWSRTIWLFYKIKNCHFQLGAGWYNVLIKFQANLMKGFWKNRKNTISET